MKRSLGVAIATIALLITSATPAFASGSTLHQITYQNQSDFTINGPGLIGLGSVVVKGTLGIQATDMYAGGMTFSGDETNGTTAAWWNDGWNGFSPPAPLTNITTGTGPYVPKYDVSGDKPSNRIGCEPWECLGWPSNVTVLTQTWTFTISSGLFSGCTGGNNVIVFTATMLVNHNGNVQGARSHTGAGGSGSCPTVNGWDIQGGWQGP